MVILIIAVSMLGKIGGGLVAARILGNTWRYAVLGGHRASDGEQTNFEFVENP